MGQTSEPKANERIDGMPVWESCLRTVVADTLGLDSPDSLRQASLVDDLAVDSLDLVAIASAVENRLGVPIETRAIRGVHSYGDLVTVVTDRLGPAGRALSDGAFSACCIPASGGSVVLVRSGALTPYDVELLVDDCLALGTGSRLEVRASSLRQRTRRWFDEHLDRLRRGGVDVVVSWSAARAPG